MKCLFAASKANLLCLYCFAIVILLAEYLDFMGDARSRASTSPLKSVMYHNYCVHYDVIAPAHSDFDRIGQILHVSSDMLDYRIVEQITNWDAPMSLTVVIRNMQRYGCTVNFLRHIQRDFLPVAQYLRAHLVFAKAWSENCTVPPARPEPTRNICEKTNASIDQIALYPANLARNVARMFSATKYIVITDYEHFFSEDFEATVKKVADRRLAERKETMLVYRIFEVNDQVERMPRDKAELDRLFKKGDAIVFHARFYPGGHDIDGLTEWFDKNETTDGLFATNLRYKRASWEPQFVSHWQIPLHDEIFPFQIRDNTVLRWEMCRANYTIDILDNVFMYHKGIKERSNGARTRAIQRRNAKKFAEALQNFKQRMDREYPQTKRICPDPGR